MLISFALTYANLYCSTKFNLVIHMVGTLIHISSTKSPFFLKPLNVLLMKYFILFLILSF